MREEALALAREKADPAQKLNVLREYVQACVALCTRAKRSFAFLCGRNRAEVSLQPAAVSEDLDFSLEMKAAYEPIQWMEKVKRIWRLPGLM